QGADTPGRVLELATGKKSQPGVGQFPSWSTNSQRVSSHGLYGDGHWFILNADNGALQQFLRPWGLLAPCLAWSPEGTELLCVSGGPSPVTRWDVASGRPRTFTGWPTNTIHHLDWPAKGKEVLSSSADGSADIWDPAQGKLVRSPKPGGVFSPDGKRR